MSMTPSGRRQPGLAAAIWMYTVVRIVMVALVTGLLVLAGVPLLIALLAGLIVALPLSMVLFRGLRARLDEAIALAQERRAGERAALRSRLRGDETSTGTTAGTTSGDTTDAMATGAGPAEAGPTTDAGRTDAGPTEADSDERPAHHHAQAQSDRGEH